MTAIYEEPTVVIAGWSPQAIQDTVFTETRRLESGYDKQEVEDFKARMAEDKAADQRRIMELESRVARMEANQYEGDYEFPEAEVNAAMRAQLAIEEQMREFYTWREDAIGQVEAELAHARAQLPPQVDIHDLVGSFKRKQEWIDRHQDELLENANELLPVLNKIVEARSQRSSTTKSN